MRNQKFIPQMSALILFMVFSPGCGDDGGNGKNENINDNTNQNYGVCGNGVIEEDEVCDGADLAGQDCVSQGFDGGELTCATDCNDLISANCCMSGCGENGDTECDGDVLKTCSPHASGCLDWTLLDCADAGQICHDTGNEALCAGECVSDCDIEGARRCNEDIVEMCMVNGVCLNWAQETVCGETVGCDEGVCRPDMDNDGYSEFFGDCDDNDADVYPGAPEVPGDGIDQNCDGPDGRVGIDQYVEGGFAVSALAFAIQTCVSDATDDCYVYVERSTFEITEPFVIENDSGVGHEVGVIGGYDTDGLFLNRHFGDETPSWQGTFGDSTEFATLIRYNAPTTEQRTVSITGSHPDNLIWLNGLRIEGPDQLTSGGATVALSIFGGETAARIDKCLIVGGTAGDGSDGNNGASGNSGGIGGSGGGGIWGDMGPTSGGSGGASSCGAAGHQGAWSHWYDPSCTIAFAQSDQFHGTNGTHNTQAQPNCNSYTLPMKSGGPGGDGINGVAGACGVGGEASAVLFGVLEGGLWTPPAAATAASSGTNGSGGYGGGSGGGYIGACSDLSSLLGGAGGGGGGGGCAGEAGGAGGHGGSAFGILITDVDSANITLGDLTVYLGTAGSGGDSGSGGNGGNGAAGGNKGYGSQWGGGKTCSSGSGGVGGAGGVGGGGGGGAGGNGGNTLGIGASVIVDDSGVTYVGGLAGTSGIGAVGGSLGSGGNICDNAGDGGSDGESFHSKMDY